jgi:thymidylate kinase
MRGLVVTFSGVDGSGKTTQTYLLIDCIRQLGGSAARVWSRVGHTSLCRAVKNMFARVLGRQSARPAYSTGRPFVFANSWCARLWVAFSLLDLIRIYCVNIRLFRLTGKSQICDRYLWDALADLRLIYPSMSVERWWLWRLLARTAVEPDAAFLLELPLEEVMRRSRIEQEQYRDPPDVVKRRFRAYELAPSFACFAVLDGLKPPELLHLDVLKRLRSVKGAADRGLGATA